MKDKVTGEWKYLEDDEIEKLLSAVPAKWSLLFRMVAKYGFRISEALHLTPSNIKRDGDDLALVFVRAKRGTRKNGKPKPPIITRVAIPESIREELLTLAAQRLPNARLFPINRVYAWKLLQRAAWKTGVDESKAHPHAFRHSCGRRWVADPSCSLWEVQAMLGHRNIKSMEPYTFLASSVKMSKKFLGE